MDRQPEPVQQTDIPAITNLKQSCNRAIHSTDKVTTRIRTAMRDNTAAMITRILIIRRTITTRTSEFIAVVVQRESTLTRFRRSSFNGHSTAGPNAGTASPGARSGHGVVDPSAPEPFPPHPTSPGARQMSHDIPGHHSYDPYYSGAQSGYGNYDGYSSQYGDNPQSASASSWHSSAQQK